MALVCWDARGVIFIHYLQKGRIINGEYHANLLRRSSDKIEKKRSHLVKKKMLFYQNNAPVHTTIIAIAKINELKFKLLPHAPYSPDLTRSDYFLFPNLKNGSVLEDLPTMKRWSLRLKANGSNYKQSIETIEHRWKKCIELKGDYVEK